jgi:hypothetical protein
MRTGHRVLTTSRYAQRRRRRRRSSGGIPPHTPSCWPVDTAQSRHSARTGHDLQITTAARMSRALSANHRAGFGWSRHSARSRHVMAPQDGRGGRLEGGVTMFGASDTL